MRIAFCVYGVDAQALERTEFYRQDLEILRELGDVRIVTHPLRVPRKTDVAYVWWWNYLWLWGPILKARSIPVVTTGVFDVEPYFKLRAPVRLLKKWGLKFSDVNIFLSRDEERDVPAAAPLKQGSIRYSPLGVDVDYYAPADGPKERVILNVCWQKKSNIERKMVPELLEAFGRLAGEAPDLRLVLAGPPCDGGEILRRRAEELGLRDRVDFPGEISRDEKRRRMQTCAVYCQVSRYEGFGLAIAEAMACGAPVLVARAGAVPEVVGDCGFYVGESSVDGIYRGLNECLAAPAATAQTGARAAARIRAEFSLQRRRADLRQILSATTA